MATGKSIFIVEDDEVVRLLTCDVLEELGYTVYAAASPHEALDQLSQLEQIDLLLTDLNLPNMGGNELACAARKLHPNLPVLLASGYLQGTALEVQQSPLNTGSSGRLGVIGKPFTLDQLRLKVHELLME